MENKPRIECIYIRMSVPYRYTSAARLYNLMPRCSMKRTWKQLPSKIISKLRYIKSEVIRHTAFCRTFQRTKGKTTHPVMTRTPTSSKTV